MTLAPYVKAFLLFTSLSRFLLDAESEFTIAICEIYALDHPTLNIIGSII